MKKILASIGVTAVAAALAVPAFAAGPTVKVGDDYFKAKTVRIKPGQTVKWTWVGSDSHNVRFRGFGSRLQNDGTYRHTFKRKGTFRYVCTLHADKGMKGTVIVAN
jgi:plastocyanin